MLVGGFSTSINFLLIALFILLLNFSISALSSYPLPLAALQNSCINSSMVFPFCSIPLSSATFTNSLSSPPNFFLNSNKNSPADPNSTSSVSKSSSKFSFHMSTKSSYTYNSIYWIFFSTIAHLIFILRYSLYTVIKPPTFPASPLKTSGLAISILVSVLDLSITPSTPTIAPSVIRIRICTCIATNYFCCYLMIWWKLYWFMVLYDRGELMGDANANIGGKLVLASISDSYSKLETILVSASRFSSCLILYYLLTTFSYWLLP